MTAWRSGKMPTTSVRLRASLFSRSFIGPHGSGKRVGGLGGWSTFEPGAVVAERVGDVGVAGGFAVPAAGAGVRLRVCQQGGNARVSGGLRIASSIVPSRVSYFRRRSP